MNNLAENKDVLFDGKVAIESDLNEKELFDKAKLLKPEQIRLKVNRLGERAKFAVYGHDVKVVVDPSMQTWSCARVPKKTVLSNGQLVDSDQHVYFVAMPYHHLAIDDEDFILGELRHELGHALYTNWAMDREMSKIAQKEGYSKDAMHDLLNCIEDPRMERVSALMPHEQYVKNLFWRKNKRLIIPNISKGLEKCDPVSQLDFLIKLYSLCKIHAEDADRENLALWDNVEALNEDVIKVWPGVKAAIDEIVGVDLPRPVMFVQALKEKVLTGIWPAKKMLIDKYGEPPKQDGKGKGQGGQLGKEGGDPFANPDNINNLPPDVQSPIRSAIEKYISGKKKEAEEQARRAENAKNENQEIDNKQNARLEKKDGIHDPDARKKYNELLKKAMLIKKRLEALFDRYFPKIAYPRMIWGAKGAKYSPGEHLRRYNTGYEKPLGRKNIPEKAGFVLQIIIDKSGSMAGERINQTLVAAVGLIEAAQDYPIYIEILASGDKNGGTPEVDKDLYIIKAFDEEFTGKVKEKIVRLLSNCDEGNKDAESLQFAVPRILKEKRRISGDYDKIAALTVFLSDAEIENQQDPNVVNELRKSVPIIGGCIENNPKIKAAVERAYGPDGEGSFCPDTSAAFPAVFEKVISRRILRLFRT